MVDIIVSVGCVLLEVGSIGAVAWVLFTAEDAKVQRRIFHLMASFLLGLLLLVYGLVLLNRTIG